MDDLPPIQFTSLQLHFKQQGAGKALAAQVRQWPEVSAASFNDVSGLLVVVHTHALPQTELIQRVAAKAQQKASIKVFEASGPQCPVPAEFLYRLPGYLLWFGIATGAFTLMLFYRLRHA